MPKFGYLSPLNSIWKLWFDNERFGDWLFYNCIQNNFLSHLYDRKTIKKYLTPLGALEYVRRYGDDPLLKEKIKKDQNVTFTYFRDFNDSEEIKNIVIGYFGYEFFRECIKMKNSPKMKI